MAIPPEVSVTVVVPTFHRPTDLDQLVPLLVERARAAALTNKFSVGILVVDNDPTGSARRVVNAFADASLRYVIEPTPGISAVRNRAIDEVGTGLLAFIDDDERPSEAWLADLLTVWSESRAALVAGRVVAEFEGPLLPWLAAGEFFRRRSLPTGTRLDVAAAGNLLIDLDQIIPLGVRFAGDLGLSGGEDTLFSRQLHQAGAVMVWCDTSVVVDMVPRSRMTRRWVLTRAWSHGNSTGLVELRLARGPVARGLSRIRSIVGGIARAMLGIARFSVGLVSGSRRHQARGLRMAFRGAGLISGALGFVYQEYRRKDIR